MGQKAKPLVRKVELRDFPRYDFLLCCYQAGQIKEEKWLEFLKVEHFAAYVKKQQELPVAGVGS